MLQIISICLLIYLCVNAFMGLDFVASMHKGWVTTEKKRIDAADNIETAKLIAKEKLDIVERNNREHSKRSYRSFLLLLIVIVIQAYLLATTPRQSVAPKKMVE